VFFAHFRLCDAVSFPKQSLVNSKSVKISSFVLIVTLACGPIVNGQKRSVSRPRTGQTQEATELAKLKDDYLKSTKELKASLQRLLALYEASERKAEARFVQSKELFKEALITRTQLDENERAIEVEKAKVEGVRKQISDVDSQIVQTLAEIEKPETKAELVRQYRRASVRQPTCRNWTLTASRHESGRTVTVTFKLVCKY
jgi:hypothetical protein